MILTIPKINKVPVKASASVYSQTIINVVVAAVASVIAIASVIAVASVIGLDMPRLVGSIIGTVSAQEQ